MLLKKYLKALNLGEAPATLQEFTAKVVTPTIEAQKREGAVAIKFEAAYLRTLDFGPIPQDQAAYLDQAQQIYAHYVKGGAPAKEDYLKLQDYLFRYIAHEAGRLGLPVHLHTGGGCGGYFFLAGFNPLLLDPRLNYVSLPKKKFLLPPWGAGPFTKITRDKLMKPNVYAHISAPH